MSETRIIPPNTFKNSDFTNQYKKNTVKTHRLKNYKEIQTVLNGIFRNLKEALIENEGGVVMEGLGYFAYYLPSYKRFKTITYTEDKKALPNYETQFHNPIPHLFTDIFSINKLKGWTMSKAFSRAIMRAPKKITKLYYKEVKAIYKKSL